MSDTPRTDAIVSHYADTTAFESFVGEIEALARNLERENARLREALRTMTEHADGPHFQTLHGQTHLRNARAALGGGK